MNHELINERMTENIAMKQMNEWMISKHARREHQFEFFL
jgi:hypothetical protein